MARFRIVSLAACAVMMLATAARPQEASPPATLIADRVEVRGNGVLLAEGAVEVLYGDTRLKAARVVYDETANKLTLEGPIAVLRGEDTVILADSAELSPDLQRGLLRSARMVLRQQVQLAAAEIRRVQGRYSRLDKVVASSCQVCADRPTPLWQIRARRVIHDDDERQLYFDHARLEVLGLPVFYLPRLRLPDPTLERATGFLIPRARITNRLGTGVKLPYFIALGDHADITVTPYFSTSQTRTLELRYRHAFRNGEVEINGALSRDSLEGDETRRYVFGYGAFDLPDGFKLDFGVEMVSDPAYLVDYGYSDRDRLKSNLSLTRVRRDEMITGDLVHFHSLRDGEANRTLPNLVADLSWRKRVTPRFGGIATFGLDLHGHRRTSDADPGGLGRDMGRLSALADWRGDWISTSGLILTSQTALRIDHFLIGDDDDAPETLTRVAPFVAAELRWPLSRTGKGGVTHVLEPVAQLVWSREDGDTPPNDDSTFVEFDEGNLFSLGRFSGADRVERGLRANLGLRWTRYDPAGWSSGLTVGRILREDDLGQFGAGSGLEGLNSDWLVAFHLGLHEDLTLTNRALFDSSLDFTRNEFRMDWRTDIVDLSSSLIWIEASAVENRPDDLSEWVTDAAYRINRHWTGKADWRYDFVNDRTTRAGVGLEYRNECVSVDLSLSRRFTTSTNLDPSTDFSMTVSLHGFTARDDRSYNRSCTR
ncbi:LPS-assembly protein [Rhodovulum imhoffii]|uniref:LPS-assembly protein LptD n=1 Tax=Rhodovulum imhoffii TaxID=365340 RepID=A0A2T5BVL2_9RHOB|nr:LPS assembly protein LptD [Rhodovulum imhoffii]MBK5932817.1 hypothetical protein [Rhodovulum imhoffii]PTN03614.1 LPS-assembly protein [Rhodovulum imhoffii]